MTDRITNGKDEIAEQNGEDSPGEVTGLFPGMEDAMRASVALTRLTGIGFNTTAAVTVDEFDRLTTP